MTAARTFGVECVDHPLLHCADRIFDKATFIQRVGMDHDLYIHGFGNRKAGVNRCRRSTPVFMQFQRAGTANDLFLQRRRD